MNKFSGKKVFVGLSGGVDSSVSAALLQKAGLSVTGVFIRVWQPEWLPCTWRDDRRDAMRVAAKLNIPFLTLNLEKEYKKEVIDSMLRDYKAGRTPNPDVLCNKEIKFGAFFRYARKMGAEYVATGHYARIKQNQKSGKYELMVGLDKAKDQSYFLWTLGQDILSRTLFPVGGFKKEKVRTLAKKFGLPTSDKKDSQGLCFIGQLDMKEFLSHYLKSQKGDVLSVSGEKIGFHYGAWLFTYGERHGFTTTKKTAADSPLFVIGKDVRKNTITVGGKDKIGKTGEGNKIKLAVTNWASGRIPATGKRFSGVLRYHASQIKLNLISAKAEKAIISFQKIDQPVTPGQSLVIYDKEVCLGGGVVE